MRNYLKTAWRHFCKHPRFSLLNLAGLSAGLACVFLIGCWISHETLTDHFNPHNDQLFQVMKNNTTPEGITTTEHTPGMLAATLLQEMPEVEKAVAVVPPSKDKQGIISYSGKDLKAGPAFLSEQFFEVFSFPVIQGNKANLFNGINEVALSEEMANKLFASSDCVGRAVEFAHKDFSGTYLVSAVFRNPFRSTMKLDIAFNYSLYLLKNQKLLNWGNSDPSTFVLLKDGANPRNFNDKIKGLVQQKRKDATATLFVQQYSSRYLHNVYENGQPAGGRIEYVRLFGVIAVFILLIACINFINLSTAKNAASIKEAGLKKIIGASREVLILQYLSDAILMAVLAMIIGIVITWLLLPQLSMITGAKIELPSSAGYIVASFAIALLTGLAAGIYPAIYLSSFKPAVVLSGSIKRSATESGIRKGLMVFQFALSVFFIIGVSVVWQQLKLIQTKDLGYQREQLIYFDMAGLPASKDTGNLKPAPKNFLPELKKIPGVVDAASFGHNITNRDGGTTDLQWPGKDPDEKISFTDIAVGYRFIETAGIRMQEGRPYDESYGTDQGGIIFNQAAIGAMNMKDPIGKVVKLWGKEKTIIGVVKNFNFQSLHEKLKPCFLDLVVGGRASKVMARIDKQNTAGTIAAIDALFRREQNGLAFDYTFLNDDYEAMYATENSMLALAKYFTFLAILISCLGLLGYTAFMARQKQKEIGIRKVAGASVIDILKLLAMEFLKPVFLGLLIAFPVGCWLMNNWLAGFAYRVNMGPGVFILAGVIILLIMLFSIGGQLIRAATVSPAQSLKQ